MSFSAKHCLKRFKKPNTIQRNQRRLYIQHHLDLPSPPLFSKSVNSIPTIICLSFVEKPEDYVQLAKSARLGFLLSAKRFCR